jgi:hypothetical protein
MSAISEHHQTCEKGNREGILHNKKESGLLAFPTNFQVKKDIVV